MTHQVSLGSELRFSCSYIGVPLADIVWIQNSTIPLMNESEGVTILAPGNTMSTIMISPVRRDSGGTYTCNATNTVGSDAATYEVLVLSEFSIHTTTVWQPRTQ